MDRFTGIGRLRERYIKKIEWAKTHIEKMEKKLAFCMNEEKYNPLLLTIRGKNYDPNILEARMMDEEQTRSMPSSICPYIRQLQGLGHYGSRVINIIDMVYKEWYSEKNTEFGLTFAEYCAKYAVYHYQPKKYVGDPTIFNWITEGHPKKNPFPKIQYILESGTEALETSHLRTIFRTLGFYLILGGNYLFNIIAIQEEIINYTECFDEESKNLEDLDKGKFTLEIQLDFFMQQFSFF